MNLNPPVPYHELDIAAMRVAEAILGEGKPVVMLHGWGVHAQLVWPLALKLAPLGYRVHVFDLPGHGRSEAPSIPWSVHDYAAFVLQYLDFHHLQEVFLFGHSFGGRLGLILGADNSDRVKKMVLADAAGIRSNPPIMKRARLAIYKSARDGLNAVGLQGLSNQLRAWYTRRYGSPDYQAAQGVMRETFLKVVNEDLSAYAARVQIPTLLIWGECDEDTPLWQAKRLESLIPDVGLVVYPGAGHFSYLENLDQTARALDALFK